MWNGPSAKIVVAELALTWALGAQPVPAQQAFGPVNLVKIMPTPFASQAGQAAGPAASAQRSAGAAVAPITIGLSTAGQGQRSLSDRLVSSRLYLPGRMILGKPAQFTIKGRPGAQVALAMADRNSGARPILGHQLRLGPDRKVVSVGRIPESGVLTLVIDTPIQGDLIGQNWFFEAALWTGSDFSDLELAVPVTSEGQEGIENGVVVSAEAEQNRGLKFVADPAVPLYQRPETVASPLGSGRL